MEWHPRQCSNVSKYRKPYEIPLQGIPYQMDRKLARPPQIWLIFARMEGLSPQRKHVRKKYF
jgi:hypothetical protein